MSLELVLPVQPSLINCRQFMNSEFPQLFENFIAFVKQSQLDIFHIYVNRVQGLFEPKTPYTYEYVNVYIQQKHIPLPHLESVFYNLLMIRDKTPLSALEALLPKETGADVAAIQTFFINLWTQVQEYQTVLITTLTAAEADIDKLLQEHVSRHVEDLQPASEAATPSLAEAYKTILYHVNELQEPFELAYKNPYPPRDTTMPAQICDWKYIHKIVNHIVPYKGGEKYQEKKSLRELTAVCESAKTTHASHIAYKLHEQFDILQQQHTQNREIAGLQDRMNEIVKQQQRYVSAAICSLLLYIRDALEKSIDGASLTLDQFMQKLEEKQSECVKQYELQEISRLEKQMKIDIDISAKLQQIVNQTEAEFDKHMSAIKESVAKLQQSLPPTFSNCLFLYELFKRFSQFKK